MSESFGHIFDEEKIILKNKKDQKVQIRAILLQKDLVCNLLDIFEILRFAFDINFLLKKQTNLTEYGGTKNFH